MNENSLDETNLEQQQEKQQLKQKTATQVTDIGKNNEISLESIVQELQDPSTVIEFEKRVTAQQGTRPSFLSELSHFPWRFHACEKEKVSDKNKDASTSYNILDKPTKQNLYPEWNYIDLRHRQSEEIVEDQLRLGISFTKQQKWEYAENCFKEVLKINPNHAETLVAYGAMYANWSSNNCASLHANKLEEAKMFWKRAIEIDPNVPNANEFLRQVETKQTSREKKYSSNILTTTTTAAASSSSSSFSMKPFVPVARAENKMKDILEEKAMMDENYFTSSSKTTKNKERKSSHRKSKKKRKKKRKSKRHDSSDDDDDDSDSDRYDSRHRYKKKRKHSHHHYENSRKKKHKRQLSNSSSSDSSIQSNSYSSSSSCHSTTKKQKAKSKENLLCIICLIFFLLINHTLSPLLL